MELIFAGIVGFIAAWLVNYLSDVLPLEASTRQPVCQHCKSTLAWDTYLKFSPCPQCKKPRSWRTFITLAAGVAFSIWLWLYPPAKMGYWLGLLVLVFFGVIVVIDAEHRAIMLVVILAGAALGLVTGIILHGLSNTLIGGLVGLGVMGAFYLVGILFARYRAKKLGTNDGEEALGLGDVYLAIVLGLLLGWPRILVGLMFGILAGGLVSLLLIIILVLAKRYQSMTVFTAYGPYLIFGAFILLYVPQILAFLSEK
jgi:prepilin signal peptidase PulO-like enzyme (type II secretory pathway)